MTRFARKDKVQGSNKREPEEATPWSEMVATIKSQHRDIEDDEEDVLMEVVEETGTADHHADDGSDDEDDSDENADIFAPKMKTSGNVESESEDDEKIYESPAAVAAKENVNHQRKVGEKAKVQEEEVDSSDEQKKKKKRRKKRPLKCLVCGSGEHKKMFCEQLPEERRKELQELYQMKVERKGKGTGRKKNKNKNKNKLPYEGNQQQDNKENEVKKGNEDKKKKNKNKKNKQHRVPKEEIRDRSGAVVEAGEAMFQGFRVRQDDKEKLDALFKELKSKGLSKSELDGAMKRERRIAEKKLARAKKLVCFNCRQPGHMLADCPTAAAAPGLHDHGRPSTGICFKCGSLDHLSKDCHSKQKREGAYSFANCFICKQDGHLAKTCPDNPKGLYPKGGGCVFCGSVEHLKRDCKRKVEKDLSAGIKVETMGDNIEDESVHISRPFVKKKKNKEEAKMSKVVAF